MSTAYDPETQDSNQMRYTTLGKLIHDIDSSPTLSNTTQAEIGGLDARTRCIEIMKAEGHIKWTNLANDVDTCTKSIERGTAPFEYIDAIIDHVVELGTMNVILGFSAIAKIASAMLKQSLYGVNRNDSVWIADTEILHRKAAGALMDIHARSVADAQPLWLSKRVGKRLIRLWQRNNAYASLTSFILEEYDEGFI
jgi:hypothetical protein